MLIGSTTTSGSLARDSAARSASVSSGVMPIAARRPFEISWRIHGAARPVLRADGGCDPTTTSTPAAWPASTTPWITSTE